ncbi:MAG: hypothetical protein CL902_00815 [Dehalococcoidia bacterium]|nr:hypothetical protein [Dehalococcoidia bacterium]
MENTRNIVFHILVTGIHLLFLAAMVSMVALPYRALRYAIWVPLGLNLLWVVFNGCPLTLISKSDSNDGQFIEGILSWCWPNIINNKGYTGRVRYATHAVMLAITAIIGTRLHRGIKP